MCELRAGARLIHGQRAFTFGHRLDVGFRVLPFALGYQEIEFCLAEVLPEAIEIAGEVGRIEPDEQVALADAGAFGREVHDLGVASRDR